MNRLESARIEIDRIDQEMASLYEQRLDAVQDVLRYKKENDLPILDASREEAILEKNQKYIQNKDYIYPYLEFMKNVMANSRAYQQSLLSKDIVAYAGIQGAFSHITCERLFPEASKRNYKSFEEVFKAVLDKEVHYGVIPLENSNSGFVGEVLDALLMYPVYIQQVVDEKVVQCLLGTEEATLKDVEWVYSKEQALFQARNFLKELDVQTIAYPNTAMAAQYIANEKDKRKAAIGSKECANIYGLKVLAPHIESTPLNTTRFLVIGSKPSFVGDRFSLCITTKHTSGALAQIIEIIAKYGINMESIQSRPIKGKAFEYFFFIEMDGNLEEENTKACLNAIRQVSQSVKVLGTYTINRRDE